MHIPLFLNVLSNNVRTDLSSPYHYFDSALFRQPSLAEGQLKPKPYRKVRSLSDPFKDVGVQDPEEEKYKVREDLCRDSGSSDSCDYPDIESAESFHKESGPGSSSGSLHPHGLSSGFGQSEVGSISSRKGNNISIENGNRRKNKNKNGGVDVCAGVKEEKNKTMSITLNAINQEKLINMDRNRNPDSRMFEFSKTFPPGVATPKLSRTDEKRNKHVRDLKLDLSDERDIQNNKHEMKDENRDGNRDGRRDEKEDKKGDKKGDRKRDRKRNDEDEVENQKETVSYDEFDYYTNQSRYSPARCRSRSVSNGEEEDEEGDSENERDVNEMLECGAALDGDVNDVNDGCDFDMSNLDREREKERGRGRKIGIERGRGRGRGREVESIVNINKSYNDSNGYAIINLFPFLYPSKHGNSENDNIGEDKKILP